MRGLFQTLVVSAAAIALQVIALVLIALFNWVIIHNIIGLDDNKLSWSLAWVASWITVNIGAASKD